MSLILAEGPPSRAPEANTNIVTDAEVLALISELKPLPPDWRKKLVPKTKPGHKEAELEVIGTNGTRFWLITRQSLLNPLDFSVIVSFQPAESYGRFNLRRYNGKSHTHSNVIERQPPFYDFHIHTATERYQKAGWREVEAYAEPTDRYAAISGALDCAVTDCAFQEQGGQRQMLMDHFPR